MEQQDTDSNAATLERAVAILRRFEAVMSAPPARDSAGTMLQVLAEARALLGELDGSPAG